MRPRRCAQECDIADALTSRSRVASPQAGASEGGRGAQTLFGDLTPKRRVGPASMRSRPASRSHPQRGPCSALRWPLLRRTRAYLAVVVCASSGTDFVTFAVGALVASSWALAPGFTKHYTKSASACLPSVSHLHGRSAGWLCCRWCGGLHGVTAQVWVDGVSRSPRGCVQARWCCSSWH